MSKTKSIPTRTLADFFAESPKGAQNEMAEALDTTTQYLSAIKNGVRTPSAAFAKRIEQYTTAHGRPVSASIILGLQAA